LSAAKDPLPSGSVRFPQDDKLANMATSTAPPAVGRIDHQELRRFLAALRLQLWWRDTLVVLAGAALLGALLFALFSPWLLATCVALAAIAAVLRQPTMVRAARVADRQLQTDSRLATAAEVLGGQLGGPLAPAQLADAWQTVRELSTWRALPQTWRKVQLACVALGVAICVVGLSLASVLTPVDLTALVGGPSTGYGGTGEPPAAVGDQAAVGADSTLATAPRSMDDLQSQASRSQAAEAALQHLADQLRTTAAARDIGDALRNGSYDDAIARLNSLATQSDQLSRTSKRELGAAMEKAAVDSTRVDPPLAVAEDRVARALARNGYAETRSAMQDLARAVTDARNGVISQEALARELNALEQQQQQPGNADAAGNIGEDEAGYIPDIPGDVPAQAGIVQGGSSTISVPGPEGDPNTASHSAVGQETGGDPFGDLTSRLDVSGNNLSVQAQVSTDQGRSGLKANPAAPVVKISDAPQNGETPSDVAQPSEPVQATAEQSVEPTSLRTSVRSYFRSDPGAAAAP